MLVLRFIAIATTLVCFCYGEGEVKKSVKRGIDDYGYPLGYNGWAATLNVHSSPILDRSTGFAPSAHDLAHIVAAAKQASHDVYLAQQYVAAAKEDVLFSQKLVKEKEAIALIAHQKSENAQQALRGEAHNVVLNQQKLAKAKSYAAELQLKQAVKDAEAARAIQSSATQAHGEIQKAEQAAKLSYFKQSIKGAPGFPGASAFPAPWAIPPYAAKPILHGFHSHHPY